MLSIEEREQYRKYCERLSRGELRCEINLTADLLNFLTGEKHNNEFIRLSIAQKVLEEREKITYDFF